MKKFILGTLFSLLLASTCYAGVDAHGGSVTIAEDLTIANNLNVASQATLGTAIISGNLSVNGTVIGQKIVNMEYVRSSAVGTTTTLIPVDDSAPQITEGAEALTYAYTPYSAANTLKIDVTLYLAHSVAGATMVGAVFKDTTAGAIACGMTACTEAANQITVLSFTEYLSAGGNTPSTYSVRYGSNSGSTTTLNGESGARLGGGVLYSTMTITEIRG